MKKWRIEDSEELYNIKGWGVNYFGINEKGHVYVTPKKNSVQVDLKEVVDYCGSSYSVEELEERLAKRQESQVQADLSDAGMAGESPVIGGASPLPRMDARKNERMHATIQMQILHCRACGAELAVNGVEVSSFCAYCGQATVVMDRVDEYLKPDYVMPFKVTQSQAEGIIRGKISAGAYVPDDIKHFEIEKLRGIYVPFWLYDVYYGDDQYWKYTVKRGKSTVTRYSHRLADCQYSKLTLDASRNLNDSSSQRLEPYHVEDLKPFEAMYLSGFYADRFDVGQEDTEALAIERSREMFNDAVKDTIKHGDAKLVHSNPVRLVTNTEYALLPVWFLTFRNEGFPYTMLVNGQTGKMVGAVPYVRVKAWVTFVILAVICCVALTPLGGLILDSLFQGSDNGKSIGGFFALTIAGIAGFWSSAYKKYKALQTSIALTRLGTTSRFVKERQDR